jgi:hypothetical protein
VLGAIAWLAALVVVIGVAVGGRDFGAAAPTPRPPTVAAPPTPSSPPPLDPIVEPNARINMVHGPMGVTVGFGHVWVVTAADLRLRRIDPAAAETQTVIDLPFVPSSPSATPLPTASGETAFATIAGGMSPAGHDLLPLVAVGAGTVWVLGVPSAAVLVGVDPASGRVLGTIRLPAAGTGVVSGPGGTWVTTDAGLLIGIDVARGALGPIVRFGSGRVAAAAGTDATWVSSSDGRIVRLDRRGRVTATIDGGGGPIAVDEGSVWVRTGGTLIQIDERTGRSIGRRDVATSGDVSVAWALPSIVTLDYDDAVARIAPREAWVAETARTLWLCRPDRGELWRIERPG